jgi:hypothetical protein
MVVYEIEDTNGNILLAFRVDKGQIQSLLNCVYADEDNDYIFNTDDVLVRIQLEGSKNIEEIVSKEREKIRKLQTEMDRLWDKAVRNIPYEDLITSGLNDKDKNKYYELLEQIEKLEEICDD